MRKRHWYFLPLGIFALACGGSLGGSSNAAIEIVGGPNLQTPVDVWTVEGDSTDISKGIAFITNLTAGKIRPLVGFAYDDRPQTIVITNHRSNTPRITFKLDPAPGQRFDMVVDERLEGTTRVLFYELRLR